MTEPIYFFKTKFEMKTRQLHKIRKTPNENQTNLRLIPPRKTQLKHSRPKKPATIASSITGRDLYGEGRTLENLGIANLTRGEMHDMLQEGI